MKGRADLKIAGAIFAFAGAIILCIGSFPTRHGLKRGALAAPAGGVLLVSGLALLAAGFLLKPKG